MFLGVGYFENRPSSTPGDATTNAPTTSTTSIDASSEPDEAEDIVVETPMNFEELQSVNSEIYAWIKIPGTDVDYPILQSASEPSYYLTHNVNREKSVYGAIYTQFYNKTDFSDYNTLIYGHNMRNGTMFGSLRKFRDKAFFDANQYIEVYMPGRILKYRIFAAFVFDDRHIMMSFDFDNEADRQLYLDTIYTFNKGVNNHFREDVTVGADDKIITLSTCTSKDDERYLVEGVLVYDSKNP